MQRERLGAGDQLILVVIDNENGPAVAFEERHQSPVLVQDHETLTVWQELQGRRERKRIPTLDGLNRFDGRLFQIQIDLDDATKQGVGVDPSDDPSIGTELGKGCRQEPLFEKEFEL